MIHRLLDRRGGTAARMGESGCHTAVRLLRTGYVNVLGAGRRKSDDLRNDNFDLQDEKFLKDVQSRGACVSEMHVP